MGYLTVVQFRVRTIMPMEDVDQLEVSEPGFLQQSIDDWSDEINARLRKRYAVPFADPPPTVLRWLTKLVTRDAYSKRGFNPSSKSDAEAVFGAAVACEAELKEAADAENGLFELPLKPNEAASGVSQGGPFSNSQASPYAWTTAQRDRAYTEDR